MTVTTKKHKVYQYIGHEREILYIGLSKNLGNRDKAHSADKPWYSDEVCDFKLLGSFDSRKEALEFEKQQIQLQRPKYNVTHNTDKPASVSKNVRIKKAKKRVNFVRKPIFIPIELLDEALSKETIRRWENKRLIVDVSGSITTLKHREILDVIFSKFEGKEFSGGCTEYSFTLHELEAHLENTNFFSRYGVGSEVDTKWFDEILSDLTSVYLSYTKKGDEVSSRCRVYPVSTKLINDIVRQTLSPTNKAYTIGFNRFYLEHIEQELKPTLFSSLANQAVAGNMNPQKPFKSEEYELLGMDTWDFDKPIYKVTCSEENLVSNDRIIQELMNCISLIMETGGEIELIDISNEPVIYLTSNQVNHKPLIDNLRELMSYQIKIDGMSFNPIQGISIEEESVKFFTPQYLELENENYKEISSCISKKKLNEFIELLNSFVSVEENNWFGPQKISIDEPRYQTLD